MDNLNLYPPVGTFRRSLSNPSPTKPVVQPSFGRALNQDAQISQNYSPKPSTAQPIPSSANSASPLQAIHATSNVVTSPNNKPTQPASSHINNAAVRAGSGTNGYDIANEPIIQALQIELSKVTNELIKISKEREHFAVSTSSIEADRKKREEEINLVHTKLHTATQDLDSLKQQLHEKTHKDEEYKREIERLSSQLAFKERELKEISSSSLNSSNNTTTTTTTASISTIDISSSSSPVQKNNNSSTVANNNKRYAKDQELQVSTKKFKTEVDKENQILRASVASLKERLKRVKRALYSDNNSCNNDSNNSNNQIKEDIILFMKQQINDLKNQLANNNTENSKEILENKKLIEQLKEARKHIEMKDKQISELKKDRQNEIDRSRALRLENENQRENLLTLFNKSVCLEQQIESIQLENTKLLQSVQLQKDSDLKQIESNLLEKEKEIQSLKDTILLLDSNNASQLRASDELQQLTVKNKELEKSKEQQLSEIEVLNANLLVLYNKNMILEQYISQLGKEHPDLKIDVPSDVDAEKLTQSLHTPTKVSDNNTKV